MATKSSSKGVVKGEICNRNGCAGIIDEHEKDGSCACHIHPPCSYCTTDTAYCPTCDWSCEDEVPPPIDKEQQEKNRLYYKKQNEEYAAKRNSFYRKFRGEEPAKELEWWTEPHTHFTMIKRCVFPKGTQTPSSLSTQLKGTFGGRFERITDYCISYIAYTD